MPTNPPFGGYFNQSEFGQPAGYPGSAYGLPLPPQGPSLFGFGGRSGGSGVEGALQSIMPMFAEMLRTQMGGFGFNFGSDMNIAASEFARKFVEQLNQARTAGAAADTGQVNDLLRGMARMIGHTEIGRTPFGQVMFAPEVEQAMGRLTGDITGMLPILASMFPDEIDRFMPRGSMTVGAASFVNAGRFITDPATGRPISEDPQYGIRVLSDLLSDRSGKTTAGLGAGRLGQTFEQLVSAGLVGSSDGRTVAALDFAGLPGGEIARGVQGNQVKEQIKAYSQVIASINDIFAEAGRPNAPMGELIKGLQTLTQGGFGAYDPASLTRVVRTIHAASQTSGMSIDQISQMATGIGGSLRQYGASELLAGPFAAYAAAVRQSYSNLGFGRPSLEGPSVDQFRNLYADSLAAGAGSQQMNMLGSLVVQAQYAAPGTPLAAVGAALKAGQTRVALPGGGTIDLLNASSEAIEQLFKASGLDSRAYLTQMQATNQNRAAVVGLPISLTESAQANEFYNQFYASGLQFLAGGDQEEMSKIMAAIVQASGDQNLTSDADLAQRASAILGRDGRFASMLGPQITNLAGAQTRFRSGLAAFRAYGGGVSSAAEANYADMVKRGDRLGQLSHLMRGGWTRNIGRAISENGFGDPSSALRLVLRMAGMVTNDEVNDSPAYGQIQSMLPGAAGMAVAESVRMGLLARAPASPYDALGAAMAGFGPLGRGVGAALGATAAGSAAHRAALAGGKAVDLKADIAKLEIKVEGGNLAAVLSAAGAFAAGMGGAPMTGDGSAVPPGGP